MVSLNNIKFSYGSVVENIVFNNLSLHISSNEIITIIGNSGSGKTTLLNIIARLLQVDKGEILISINNLVYLTQVVTLLPYRNSFENSLLGLELRGDLSADKIEEVRNLFSKFDLGFSNLAKFPHELSGGMKQRIGIIQALIIDTSLYLLDEPFTALDRNVVPKIQNIMWDKFKINKSSALIVTHDLEQAVMMSDKVFVMPSSFTNKIQEITFSDKFVTLSPSERRKASDFEKNLIILLTALTNS